jgi:hypothetical protein
MNQSICPLPFAPASDKGVVEGNSLLHPSEDSAPKDFHDLLDSELDDVTAETQKATEVDPWTLYGHAQPVPQLLQILVPVSGEVSANIPLPTEPLESARQGLAEEISGGNSQVSKKEGVAGDSGEENPSLETLLRVIKPTLQNIPLQNPMTTQKPEQIAGNPLEAAKMTNGIPAAQGPSMLFADEKEEESATQQSIALSEAVTDSGFEAEILVRTNNSPRESASKGDYNLPEVTPVNAVTPEWSSFEGVLDVAEVQAPRKTESTEIAQAIRTHVELLRTSGQDKVDVVLRPDGQTELRLHVEKVNGQILIQARCDRGDFARLDANWGAIQQSLATQGVRVEALQNGATLQNDSQHWNHSSTSSGEQFGSREENKTRFIEQERFVPTRPKQSATSSGSARGWQSWA